MLDERLRDILDRARWAPSGDNEQPWRFEVVADDHVVVHGHDTRHRCVYDLDGSGSQIGLGALLETMAIAASRHGLQTVCQRDATADDEHPVVDVRFVKTRQPGDPLGEAIEKRTVQRRAMPTRPLTDAERDALEESVGPGYSVVWREGSAARRRMAGLLYASAKIRLVIPEAYTVHRDAIDWGRRFSDDRVPEQAVGLDPLTAQLMRWVMQRWSRVQFFNRYLAGTVAPRLQLDVIPALRCAAHFLLVADRPPSTIDDFIATGRALQRFWLTAATLHIQLQPEITPLIFARFHRLATPFSSLLESGDMARDIAERLEREFDSATVANAIFMGRVGAGHAARSRSLRKPLEALLIQPQVDTVPLRRSA